MTDLPRRKAFIAARERISEYYHTGVDHPREDDYPTDDLEDERTEARVTAAAKERMFFEQVSVVYAVDKIRQYLIEMDSTPRLLREQRIRIAEKIFETVLRCDLLLKQNVRLRGVIYRKIEELTHELDDYTDLKLKTIQKNVSSIQEELMKMISSIPQCAELSTQLDQWMTDLSRVQEVDHHDYLRSLFRQIQLRRPEYESGAI